MRWDYPEEYRDIFGKGVHKDILIVPHATNVIKNPGGPPTVTSKVPEFENGQPVTSGGSYVFSDVDWCITNKDIIKEKFKYNFALNPAENITFSAAASAMVQFTIRNSKTYNPDTNRWEIDIPNLQYYKFLDEDGHLILGELEGNYIIKVYIYFNGDSSTMICLGMFRVEEDKLVDNGYNRQITAYDFMATFREMDIFNWYKHLFQGINKLDNDYLDATNKTGEETTKPDNYNDDINWVRKPKEKWTIKEALTDLIDNLAAYDMIVYNDDGSAVGCTSTNPTVYGRDYAEGNGYSGYGMPIMIDPDILTKGTQPYTPSSPGEGEFERYGYMDILELEFLENPKIMQQESLSMGKFLEDIGVLAGRYPFIRPDYFDDANYIDPHTITPTTENPHPSKYNNYERCILSFKPLPSSANDKDENNRTLLQPEQCFNNHQIVKGFEHSLFEVKEMLIVKIGFDDNTKIEYKRLNKAQRKDDTLHALQTFSFSGNLFCSYLLDTSDNDDIKKKLEEYKEIKTKLFGKENKNGNMTTDALFYQGFLNIKHRNYAPYKLTTYADPVRDVGDRIFITFENKVTGETTIFYTYILERTLEGVQKMMDTYSANGSLSSPVFSNYQAGTKYQSGFDYRQQILGYRNSTKGGGKTSHGAITKDDLVQYFRNVGIQLLDEPFVCSAKFVKTFKKSEPEPEPEEETNEGE